MKVYSYDEAYDYTNHKKASINWCMFGGSFGDLRKYHHAAMRDNVPLKDMIQIELITNQSYLEIFK